MSEKEKKKKHRELTRAEQWMVSASEEEGDVGSDEVEAMDEEEEEDIGVLGEVAESPATLRVLKEEAGEFIKRPTSTPTPPSTPTSLPSRPTPSKRPASPMMSSTTPARKKPTPAKSSDVLAVHRQQEEEYTKVGLLDANSL